jgi:hypothetical protein
MDTKPTNETYTEFQIAYDLFNKELFNNHLPDCMITYQRTAKTKGYFADGRFENTENGKIIDEIAMNPDYFYGKNISPKTILSTLVHEMCHLWQKYHGKPGRSRYHNIEGGKFDQVCDRLLEKIKIAWVDRWTGATQTGSKQKTKPNMFARYVT